MGHAGRFLRDSARVRVAEQAWLIADGRGTPALIRMSYQAIAIKCRIVFPAICKMSTRTGEATPPRYSSQISLR